MSTDFEVWVDLKPKFSDCFCEVEACFEKNIVVHGSSVGDQKIWGYGSGNVAGRIIDLLEGELRRYVYKAQVSCDGDVPFDVGGEYRWDVTSRQSTLRAAKQVYDYQGLDDQAMGIHPRWRPLFWRVATKAIKKRGVYA